MIEGKLTEKAIRIAKIRDRLFLWTEDANKDVDIWELVSKDDKDRKLLEMLMREWAK